MRILARPRSAFTAFSIAALSTGMVAASAAPQVIRRPWRAGVQHPEPMTRTAVGTLTGDLYPDAVVLDGTTAYVLDAPSHHDARAPLAAVAHDACVVAGGGLDGQDAVATVGPAGLTIHRWNGTSGDFDAQALGGPAWAGALFVLSGPVDDLGHEDIVAFAANGRTVRQLVHDGSGWSPRPGFTVPGRPHEAHLADWEGDGQLDLVLLSGPSLWTFGLDGRLKAHLEEPGHASTLAVVPGANGERDYFAWATYDQAAGTTELVLIDQGTEIQRLPLGPLEVAGMTSSDEDIDGDSDLLLISRNDRRLRRYLNITTSDAPVLSSDPPRLIQLEPGGAASPTARMGPVSADFDQDGDPDFFVMLEDAPASYFVRNTTVNGDRISAEVKDPTTSFVDGDNLVMNYALPSILPAWVDSLRVTVWRRNALNEAVPLSAHVSIDAALSKGAATAEIPLSWVTYGEVYSIEARLVGLGPQGIEWRTGPAIVGAFSMDEATYQTISAAAGRTVILIDALLDALLGRETGGYVPKDSVDPFDNGVPAG